MGLYRDVGELAALLLEDRGPGEEGRGLPPEVSREKSLPLIVVGELTGLEKAEPNPIRLPRLLR